MATITRKKRKKSKVTPKIKSNGKRFNFSEIVRSLRQEGRWHVVELGRSLELSRVEDGKPITVQLRYMETEKKYDVNFPTYPFKSGVSYFAPKSEERRVCRNRKVLASMIKVLRKSIVWQWISDKDFVAINENNKRFSRVRIKNALKEMMLG